ncbi:MAG: PorV/PorQ family protein [Elusimicrobiota bacterium]
MKRQIAFIMVLIVAFFSVVCPAGASSGIYTGLEFLKIAPGARPSALADSFVPLADDINAVSYNPAGLGFGKYPEVQVTYFPYIADMYYGFLGYMHPFSVGTFALSGQQLGGAALQRIEEGVLKDTFSPSDTAVALSYGKALGLNFAIGMTLRNVQETLDKDYSANVLTGDAGIIYRSFNKVFSFGYCMQNIGSEYRYPSAPSAISEQMPVRHSAGIAFSVAMPEHYSDINFILQVSKTGTGPAVYSAGLEHWGANTLALRFGYKYNENEKINNALGSIANFRTGVGLRIRDVDLDFTWQPFALLGDVFRFSLALKFRDYKLKPREIPISLKVDPPVFSPNGDGIKDGVFFIPEIAAEFSRMEKNASWRLDITGSQGNSVKKTGSDEDVLPKIINWDGKDEQGVYVPEGRYFAELTASGEGKMAGSGKYEFLADLTTPYVSFSVSTDTISPDGDGIADSTTFYIVASDSNTIDRWQLSISNVKNKVIKTYRSSVIETNRIEEGVSWTGTDDVYLDIVPNGEYRCQIVVWDIAGNKVSTETKINVYVPPRVEERVVQVEKVKKVIRDIDTEVEERGIRITLQNDSLFVAGATKSTIKPQAHGKLNKIVEYLAEYPDNNILIEGHTDSAGSRDKNIAKSSENAWTVYSYLVKHGVNPGKLSVKGVGPDNPVAPNTTRRGRIRNKRVTIIILK